ncbi:MAG: LysR family transcriptional regulator [Alphaproteobacteria bacterium]|nr:LysR family transcriptional regulator [Alphaproteobacteria bacterium]
MNTKQIDAVLELAQTLNFNRAAEKLCVSQPTLSYEIKTMEEEVGFKIFDRSGKGAVITPAGAQFCQALRFIRADLKNAVEQGQNFSAKYSDDISVGIPVRSMLPILPQAMMQFGDKYPNVSVTPRFIGFYNTDDFLQNKLDILIAMDFEVRHIPDIKVFPLYECGISLVARHDDILAQKKSISQEDLYGRTLMVGGGSPPALQRVQQRLIHSKRINFFNSADHDTTLTNVAANKGICLSPDFFNDFTDEFAWIPYICPEKFKIVLCSHHNDKRESLLHFIKLLQNYSQKNNCNY